jgi:hypothetical protein
MRTQRRGLADGGEGRIFTVGTVFILVRNHTAGEDSLGEALVTTRAFWHVKP